MTCNHADGLVCNCCGEDVLGSTNHQEGQSFVAILPSEEIVNALLYHVVKDSGLPSCQFNGHVTLKVRADQTAEAIVEVTWWLEGTPEPPLSNPSKAPDGT